MDKDIKLKNSELLNLILDDLKSLKTDVSNIKRDISTMKHDVFLVKTIQEVKKDTVKETPKTSSGWFY